MLAISLAVALTAQQPARCPLSNRWGIEESPLRGNRIRMTATGFEWGGSPINRATLERYIAQAGRMNPRPRLVIAAHEVDCATIQSLAALIEETTVCDPDFCRVSWDSPPPPPPAPSASSRRY